MKMMRVRCSKGFTLIELVIAIAVLSIAVGSLFVILANIHEQMVLPEILNTANFLAEKELERVSAKRFSAVLNEGPTSYTGTFSGYQYQIQISAVSPSIAVDPGMFQYKEVRITVRHLSAGGVSLTTLVTNN